MSSLPGMAPASCSQRSFAAIPASSSAAERGQTFRSAMEPATSSPWSVPENPTYQSTRGFRNSRPAPTDRLQSTINTKQAELEVLEQQVRSQEAARETLQRQAEALQNSAAASAGVLAEVEQERQATREALVAQLNGLLDRFEQEVRQPLTEAESAARASLQLLETLPQQDAGVPTLVQRAQLSKIMTRLALHSQRFKATAGAIAEALDAPEATQRVAAIDAAAANDLARTSIAETLAEVERVESDGGARIADPIGQSMERLRLQLLGEG